MKKFMSLLVFGVCAFVLFSKSVLAENDNLWNDFVNEFKTGKGYEELKDSLKSGSVSVTSTDNSLTVSYDNDGNISTSTLMYEDGVITLKEIEDLTYDNLDLNSSVVINAVTAYAELNNLDSEKFLLGLKVTIQHLKRMEWSMNILLFKYLQNMGIRHIQL